MIYENVGVVSVLIDLRKFRSLCLALNYKISKKNFFLREEADL